MVETLYKDVVYTDANGYAWLVRVTEDTLPKDYRSGIYLGPPDLSSLNIPAEKRKLLQKRLVEKKLVNAELIKGSRTVLYNTIKDTLPGAKVKDLVMEITSIYQHAFYADNSQKFYEE